jgi:hypothetical protein
MTGRRAAKIVAFTLAATVGAFCAPSVLFVAHLEVERFTDWWGRRP